MRSQCSFCRIEALIGATDLTQDTLILCSQRWSRCTSQSRSHLPLRQRVTVIISTAPIDGEASPRKSNCWLLRCVGPEQAIQLRFHSLIVTTYLVLWIC